MTGRLLLCLGLALACAASALAAVEPFESNAAVTGVVTATDDCLVDSKSTMERDAQVWVSIGQILLYQVQVPVGGSYEVHLLPGKTYDIVASNKKGCLAQMQIEPKSKQVAQVSLKMQPARGPASTDIRAKTAQ